MRMRMTLLLSLLAVSFGLTALSLAVIHTSLQTQIRQALASDLQRSIATFRNLQRQRREMLDREAALLADLPSLKALMTVLLRPGQGDERTVRDGGLEFWRVSGAAFFALSDPSEKVIARYENGVSPAITEAPQDLPKGFAASAEPQYLLSGNRLYEVISAPLYFGSSAEGTLLGYVSIGYAIDDRVAREVGEAAAAQVVFARTRQSLVQPWLPTRLKRCCNSSQNCIRKLWMGPMSGWAKSVLWKRLAGFPKEILRRSRWWYLNRMTQRAAI